MLEEVKKVIVFQIGMQFFGTEIKTLAGVLSVKEVTSVSDEKYPNARKMIGVNHDIIPVLNLHEKFQIPSLIPSENMLIVFSSDNKMLAVPIDRIETIYNVPYQNLHCVPRIVQNGENNIIRDIAVIKERLIPLFEVEQLFALLSSVVS